MQKTACMFVFALCSTPHTSPSYAEGAVKISESTKITNRVMKLVQRNTLYPINTLCQKHIKIWISSVIVRRATARPRHISRCVDKYFWFYRLDHNYYPRLHNKSEFRITPSLRVHWDKKRNLPMLARVTDVQHWRWEPYQKVESGIVRSVTTRSRIFKKVYSTFQSLQHLWYVLHLQSVSTVTIQTTTGSFDTYVVYRRWLFEPQVFVRRLCCGIQYIRIQLFSRNVGRELLVFLLRRKAEMPQYHRFIIDLRGNRGGYVRSVLDVLAVFSPREGAQGLTIINSSKQKTTYRTRKKGLLGGKRWFVILVDGDTASASEIFVLAMKLWNKKRVIVLGSHSTWGKGIGQHYISLRGKYVLALTAFRWYVGGVSIHKKGIVPDIRTKPTHPDILYTSKDLEIRHAIRLLAP